MAKRELSGSAHVEVLLAEMLADAQGEDRQLAALFQGIRDGLRLPLDVHVVGEPLSLAALEYDGNLRRGVVARCRRDDGTEYRVSLVDVEVPLDAPGYSLLAAYRTWVGVESVASRRGQKGQRNRRKHRASEEDIDVTQPLDLAILAVKQRAARCRLPGSGRILTLRTGSLHRVVAGQIATVQPSKHWRHNGHPYLSGDIISTRVDAATLGLVPLALNSFGEWDPATEYWGEEGEPLEAWAKPIFARGPRPEFEMEQVLPGSDPEDLDSDPIIAANDLKVMGDFAGACDMLDKLLEADLRCLDAHAHLGNMYFSDNPRVAISHYEVGLRIGELSLSADFEGVLPWGLIDNRPFLRCMHGYALCLWRSERWQEAEQVLERMLWLNPSDNQGNRFLLPDVRARRAWVDGDA